MISGDKPKSQIEKSTQWMNQLANETSPYLLQHAHNPVDWYPWGEKALTKAANDDKPILVSIGYSACHWCHVMERESFENQQIARIMNEHFVCIKVDREERPDVDAIYMDAVQAMGLRGGWPLNVFLMPDGKPFYGGTYFQPQQWANLCLSIHKAFLEHREELQKSAEGFTDNMLSSESEKYGLQLGKKTFTVPDLDKIYSGLARNFDTEKGGMDKAPKFPMPSIWLFLLKYAFLKQAETSIKNTTFDIQPNLTLHQMAFGGIYDQLGGGFARYSVDGEWFCPHFEKMLYDNGQLVSLYAEAYCMTKAPLYQRVVYQTIDWLRKEMTSSEGGFYAALDADSEGVEGKFYVWRKQEIEAILGEDADWFCKYYNVTTAGNWEHGNNILYVTQEPEKAGIAVQKLEICKAKLLEQRSKRIRPGLDDKILTSWNGLMLKGLVGAYRAFGEESFLQLALGNANFIKNKLLNEQGKLWRSYKNGEAKIDGFLEDYAAVIEAFVALYQATFDENWLSHAESMALYACEHFWDEADGLFFFTDQNSEKLIARKKELFDNVIPASNSIMAANLYWLGKLLDREDFSQIANLMLSKIKPLILKNPEYLTNWACLLSNRVTPTAEVVIVGEEANDIRKALDRYYFPNKIIMGTKTTSNLPLLDNRTMIGGKTTIYVCYDKTCQLPVFSVEEALKLLHGAGGMG